MKTLKEIRAAAVAAAAGSLNCGDNNLEMSRACVEAFSAAGGTDHEDYDIFERYWRAERLNLSQAEAHVKSLGDALSPSAKKAAARAKLGAHGVARAVVAGGTSMPSPQPSPAGAGEGEVVPAAAGAVATGTAEVAGTSTPGGGTRPTGTRPAVAALLALLVLVLCFFVSPRAEAQIYAGYIPIGGPNTNWAPILNHLQAQSNSVFISIPSYTLVLTNITTNTPITLCYGNQLFGTAGTNSILPMSTLVTNLSAANGYTNGGSFSFTVPMTICNNRKKKKSK
jgi:hypothetical protein